MTIVKRGDGAVALKTDGTVWQFPPVDRTPGDINPLRSNAPSERVSGLSAVTAIWVDDSSVYALRSDRSLWVWGPGPFRDNQVNFDSWAPRRIEGITDVVAVAASNGVVFAVRTDGSVWTWGDEWTWGPRNGGYWQFGLGRLAGEVRSPTRVPGLANIIAISREEFTTYALSADGSVWAWGKNGYGEWPDWDKVHSGFRPWRGAEDSTTPPPTQSLPNRVPRLKGITAVKTSTTFERSGAIHEAHVSVYALADSGVVWAWGSNKKRRLGDGTSEDRWKPVPVLGVDRAVDVVAVYGGAFVLQSDGSVWAWGDLEETSTKSWRRPTPIPGLAGIVAIHKWKYGSLLAVDERGIAWAFESGKVSVVAGPSRVVGVIGEHYILDAAEEPPGNTSRGSEGCFIATAVYGDYEAAEVRTLRRFRDERLARSAIGRAAIGWYYRWSPSLARRIRRTPALVLVTRLTLDRLVRALDRRDP